MIAVTLNFKSIEAARAALLDIPQSSLVGYVDEPKTEEAPAKKSKQPKADATSSAPASQPVEQPVAVTSAEPQAVGAEGGNAVAEPSAPAAPAAQPASSAQPVEYPVLQKAVFTLAGKDKAAALEVLAKLSVKTAKELPAERWAEALAVFNERIAQLG